MTDSLFTASAAGVFSGAGFDFRCAIGKGGMIGAAQKREGDGCSPLGVWPMRRVLFRADRLAHPVTGLACVPLRPQDGWCDASDHPLYNRPITTPFNASHEALWREDHVYNLIVELGHNDDPVVPGLGSAVFLHLARPDYRPTEGCIALSLEDMLAILRVAEPGAQLSITL